MQINNSQLNNNSQNDISYKGIDKRNLLKTLSDPDSLSSTVVLETCVTGGRGYSAYKRGGIDEFRERFIDDVVSALFWMKGVDIFNSLGNKFGIKFLKLPTTDFDVGQDALRTPFKNLSYRQTIIYGSKKAAKSMVRKLAVFKFTKIILATLLSTSVIGYIMPRLNQKISDILIKHRAKHNPKEVIKQKSNYDYSKNPVFKDFYMEVQPMQDKKKHKKIILTNKNNTSNEAFKGSFVDNTTFISHNLENNTICKMLTNDAGIITGRTLSARNKDEGLEYLFRDTSSLFFYFASTPLIYELLQKLTNSSALTNIDPVAAKTIHNNLITQLKHTDGSFKTMNVEEFKKKTLGVLDNQSNDIIKKLQFKSDVVSLTELKRYIKDTELINRAEKMSELQPKQANIGSVLTKQQVIDVFKNSSITQPDFMKKIYKERFGDKLFDEFRFISMKKITKFRNNIDDYVKNIIDRAKESNKGIIDYEFLEKLNKKSFKMSVGFRTIAMFVSAFALGIIIPKLQYLITERRTGSKSAPMFREYEKNIVA